MLFFRGYPNERFMVRWIPWGDGELEVVDGENISIEDALDRVREAVEAIFSGEAADGEEDEEDFDEDEEDDDDDKPESIR
jgi:hypothetical protein